jgi:peptidoglycan L-alanyl-D-glutamate endopeptidase CwlK
VRFWITSMNLSKTDAIELVRQIQKRLGLVADGIMGPKTLTAMHRALCGEAQGRLPEVPKGDRVDDRSEKNIATLIPALQPIARELVRRCVKAGWWVKVICGRRTYAEQEELYAKGRTEPGKIVTNARAGYSMHNFGLAFDIGIFDGTTYIPDGLGYKAAGLIGRDLGLVWGADFKTINDEPHFEIHPKWAYSMTNREMLERLRKMQADGKEITI